MADLTRAEIFAKAAEKLRKDFDELSSVPHNALKGHEAEKLIRQFLEGHLPKRFGVGSGFIIDPRDKISKQQDVVIYDAFNCPVYRASEEAAIFPSDNVAAVVEVKSTLDKDRLEEAFESICDAESLAKTAAPPLPFLINTQTMGYVFAFTSSITLDKIAEHYCELLRKHGLGHHLDLIVILDRGIISLAAKVRDYEGWAPAFLEGLGGDAAEGSHIAVGVQDLGLATLDGFLRFMLSQLTFFRGIVDHPGFNWKATPSQGLVKLTYLMSVTLEKDPVKKKEILQRYKDEVIKEFSEHPLPGKVK